MHAQPGTIGHPSTDTHIPVQVTINIRVPKDALKEGVTAEQVRDFLHEDLSDITDELVGERCEVSLRSELV